MLIAVDSGGTFTDVMSASPERGTLNVLKIPSTPDEPDRAIVAALHELAGYEANTEALVRHGTTVGTNAVLTRSGADVLFVTTAGFEDVLAIGRQDRPHLYRPTEGRATPLVSSERRIGIRERVDSLGNVLSAINDDDLRELVQLVRKLAPDSIAVGTLHSYLNPTHETRIADALEKLDIPISVSSDINPEHREFERFSTTAVNAYLAPVMKSYLGGLSNRVSPRELDVVLSDGSARPWTVATRRAVRTLVSGPAAGVRAAAELGRMIGVDNVISLDMGGTSTDVSLCHGSMVLGDESTVGGVPIRLPQVDLETVGAGGGSEAWIDPGGLLRVGPQSSGANPGPACYGNGGPATITDAHVVTGRLPATADLAQRIKLDGAAAATAIANVGASLDLSPTKTASGVIQVANTQMLGALRTVSVGRGLDPNDFTLVAFGGAGPLHAAELGSLLNVRRVIIPPHPGLLSALGLLLCPYAVRRRRSLITESRSVSTDRFWTIAAQLTEEIRAIASEEGGSITGLSIRARLRFTDQSHDLEVKLSGRGSSLDEIRSRLPIDTKAEPLSILEEKFRSEHRARFGFTFEKRPIEIVDVSVHGRGEPPLSASEVRELLTTQDPVSAPGSIESQDNRTSSVSWQGSSYDAPVLGRDAIERLGRVEGPAILSETTSTTWVPPGCVARAGDLSCIVIEQRG